MQIIELDATNLLRFDRAGKVVLRKFTADFLLQKPGEADLQELWNSTDSNYWIGDASNNIAGAVQAKYYGSGSHRCPFS